MTSWLNKQKKSTLSDLANEAGLKYDDQDRKDELITNLDNYLQKNATRLQGQASFEPYYSTRRPGKPRESIGGTEKIAKDISTLTNDVEAEVKSAIKKTTKKAKAKAADVEAQASSLLATPGKILSDVASRISSPFTSSAQAVARSPAARRVSQNLNVTMPGSPSDVAENIERATTKFYGRAGDLYSSSGIPDTVDWVRTTCSSVVGVQASILLLEAYYLQHAVFPWNFAFDLPGLPALGIPSYAVKVPDFFVLLRSSFWGPTIIWSITSIFLPLLFAYFYNLTVHPVKRNGARVQALRYPYDPMIFSIAKAITALLVYGAHAPHEYVDVYSARVVEHAMPGGYRGVVTGCFISGIAAIWEATQR